MNYTGPERRKNEQTSIAVIENDIKHLKDSVDEIKGHLEKSINGTASWWKTLIGIIVAMIIQTGVFVFYLGGVLKQVEIDGKRLDKVEQTISDYVPYRTTTTVDY